MREVGLNREMAGDRAEWRRRCQTTVDPGVPGWTAVAPGKKKEEEVFYFLQFWIEKQQFLRHQVQKYMLLKMTRKDKTLLI